MGLKEKASKFANKAAFFFFLRLNREKIVEGFRQWAMDYGMDRLKETISKGEYPDVAPDLFAKASDYMEYVESISNDYLVELLAEAVPEILEYIVSLGPDGGVYIIRLREHFLELCRHPEQAPVTDAPSGTAKSEEYATVTCDGCGKSFPVKKEKFSELKDCPFCHKPADK